MMKFAPDIDAEQGNHEETRKVIGQQLCWFKKIQAKKKPDDSEPILSECDTQEKYFDEEFTRFLKSSNSMGIHKKLCEENCIEECETRGEPRQSIGEVHILLLCLFGLANFLFCVLRFHRDENMYLTIAHYFP